MAQHEVEYINVPLLPPLAKPYVKVWGYLLGFLAVSIVGPEIAKFLDMGNISLAITLFTAFGIAFVKAWLVIRDFMHLPEEPAVIHYMLITSLAFMGLFFAGVSPDVQNHAGSRWVNTSALEAIERGMAAGEAGGHGAHGEPGAHGEHAAPDGAHGAPAEHAPPAAGGH